MPENTLRAHVAANAFRMALCAWEGRRMKHALAILAPVICVLAAPVSAQEFYANKTLKIIVGGTAGGEYDSQARTLAAHMGKHIPGNPTIIVSNLPAASGIAAANYLFNVAKKDGTEFGGFTSNSLIMPVLGDEASKFVPAEFNWLGTPGSYRDNAYLMYSRAALPWRNMAELRALKKPAIFGNKGTIFPRLLKDIFGAQIDVVEGYKGAEVNLALQRAEIDGMGSAYNNLARVNPEWLSDKFVNVLVQFGHDRRLPQFPDTPTAHELVTSPDDLALIQFCELALVLGYPFALPPGVPQERLRTLRAAFDATMQSAEYRAAMELAKLEYSPKGGAALAADIVNGLKVPPKIIERYKQLASTVGG
jgi:tripartite-type tricarboxylate transporter receptor subunit TctC